MNRLPSQELISQLEIYYLGTKPLCGRLSEQATGCADHSGYRFGF